MKKLRAILAMLMVILTLCACGSAGSGETTPAPETTQASDPAATEQTPAPETEPVEQTQPEAPPVSPSEVNELSIFDVNVSLTEVGIIEQPEDLSFGWDLPLSRESDGEVYIYTLYSYMGESLMGTTYHNYDYFSDGITAAYRYVDDDTVPQCSLINVNTGEVYLDDGACKIEPLSERVYYVIYTTEQTDNVDEAFIYFTDSMFSMGPGEDDILYKGYAKLFDLETGSFVGDLVFEEPHDIAVCADESIVVEIDWYTSDVYSMDGTLLADDVDSITVCQDVMVQDLDEGAAVYDSGFNRLKLIPDAEVLDEESRVYPFYSNRYLKVRDADSYQYGVVDMNGNWMLEAEYPIISKTFRDYVFVGTKDEEHNYYYGLCLADGTEILPCIYDSVRADDDLPMIHYQDMDEVDYLYIPGVGSFCCEDYNKDDLIYYTIPNEDDYSTRTYLVYGTGETVTYTDADIVAPLLLLCEDGLMEMINGEILISAEEFDYDRVFSTGEYLYGYDWDEDRITVYQFDISW